MSILGKRAGSAQFSTAAAKTRLIVLLAVFTTALLIPLFFLADHVYGQFQQEMHGEYKWNAERMTKLTNKHIHKMLYKEEKRAFGDYQYFKWVKDPLTHHKEKTISGLANPAKIEHIPGFIGHFQIDDMDQFSSPILPYIEKKYLSKKLNMAWDEISGRLETQAKIKKLLVDNGFLKLPKTKPMEMMEEHKDPSKTPLQSDHSKTAGKDHPMSKPRTEEASMSEDAATDQWKPTQSDKKHGNYTSFVVEIDPFQYKRSDDGYNFFFRKVWRKNKRYIQGFVVDEDEFFNQIISPLLVERKFETNVSVQMIQWNTVLRQFDFNVDYDGCTDVSVQTFHLYQSEDKKIHYGGLAQPLESLGLLFTTEKLPRGPGSKLVNMLLIVVTSVIAIGIFVFYRAGIKQILLSEERLNFVSAVSHELKTPLTSILMYSEMLKEGMVSAPDKRKVYYDFIFFESERLSRLIANVLQLSRLGKDSQAMDLELCSVNRLNDLVRSKVSTLLEKNQFTLNLQSDDLDKQDIDVLVDQDAFAQIVINLVDNAIKFSINKDNCEKALRQLDVGFRKTVGKSDFVTFYVRDYGPGVDAEQSKKIFDLFYRVGDELTRTKPGTGIGLALVSELTHAMNGSVEVINRKPGAEFGIHLPSKS
ncbi:MAG: two-component system phosphate regulon sensor histidine kinase PhoR [Phenylobacterium sp.]|jgi:two-component system phosphate regulon sensor histidine kinase PhoR